VINNVNEFSVLLIFGNKIRLFFNNLRILFALFNSFITFAPVFQDNSIKLR